VTGADSRLEKRLRMSGLTLALERAAGAGTDATGPGAQAGAVEEATSLRRPAIASVRMIANPAAIAVTAIALGRWGR
jgi:hypothetical protein